MQTVAQVKDEIYNRMESIIAEPRAKYIPGANKHVDALVSELRQISGQRAAGEAIPEGSRPRFSVIVTELNTVHGFSQSHLSEITGLGRPNLSKYIRPGGEKRYFDEKRLEVPEDKESLLADLDRIKDRKVSGKGTKYSVNVPRTVRDEDKPRLSNILTKLHISYGISINDLSVRFDMERNVLAGYIHKTTAVAPAPKQFTPGPNPVKKTWWKKSGKNYRDMWSFAQDITGISPVVTKGDYRKIAVEAVNYVNADDAVKNQLLDFIETDAFTSMQSMSGYRTMAQIPISFVQWLSDTRGREITLDDLDFESKRNPKGITASTGQRFVNDYVPEKSPGEGEPAIRSETSQAHVRSALIKFFKFLEIRGKIEKYSMLGMTTGMERRVNAVVYNMNDLDEFFNKIISGKAAYFSLLMRLLLQIGSRPGQIFSIKCRDLRSDVSTKDALGRDFYPVNPQKILEEDKSSRGEKVKKKYAPGTAMISARLKNDLEAWCKNNSLTPGDPIFGKFIQLSGIQEGIRNRTHILSGYKKVDDRWIEDKTRVKALAHDPDYYTLYGLRHTWASVIYNITKDVKHVTTSGGWASGSSVPVDVYVQSREKADVLEIAKKYEIFIDPKFMEDVAEKQKEKEPGAVMGEDKIRAMEQSNADLRKMIEDMAKRMEEMEKRRK